MTSFMLINPFAMFNGPTQPAATETVQPIQATTNNAQKNDSATNSRSDTARQQSDQANKVALFQNKATMSASGDATPKSIVNAQAYKGSATDPFGNNLPEVVMPDPLPTSPFLKRG